MAREGRSAAKVAAELGIRPPLLYRWARTERKPNEPKAGRKPGRSLENSRRRSAGCARRTPNSWSSVKS
jgi:hypothetical protein